jgi:hypothetical protein
MAHAENRIRGSLFFYIALTFGYLPRFNVCTGFADSKHSVDGSHCDKSQALDGPQVKKRLNVCKIDV